MARVTFEDGPARCGVPARGAGERQRQLGDGQADALVLHLRRLPVFVRVVQDVSSGEWDALDQLTDEPRDGERIAVYVRAGYGHARGVGRFAGYRHVVLPEPVVEAGARSNGAWRVFVGELAEREAGHLARIYKPEHALHG